MVRRKYRWLSGATLGCGMLLLAVIGCMVPVTGVPVTGVRAANNGPIVHSRNRNSFDHDGMVEAVAVEEVREPAELQAMDEPAATVDCPPVASVANETTVVCESEHPPLFSGALLCRLRGCLGGGQMRRQRLERAAIEPVDTGYYRFPRLHPVPTAPVFSPREGLAPLVGPNAVPLVGQPRAMPIGGTPIGSATEPGGAETGTSRLQGPSPSSPPIPPPIPEEIPAPAAERPMETPDQAAIEPRRLDEDQQSPKSWIFTVEAPLVATASPNGSEADVAVAKPIAPMPPQNTVRR